MTRKKQPTAGRPKTEPTKVHRIPADKVDAVAKALGRELAVNQPSYLNVSLSADEAVKAEKTIGRPLIATHKAYVFVRLTAKELDKAKEVIAK